MDMARIGLPELLVLFVVGVLVLCVTILPFWMIFKKAGFSPWLSLTQLLPLVNLVALFYLAFAEWPVHRGLRPR
jgi:hypothetical protein